MKNQKLEIFRRMQRRYHQSHPCQLSQDGVFASEVRHTSTGNQPTLSWYEDTGFIRGGRLVVVWWQHPRDVYLNKIASMASDAAGSDPGDEWLTDGGTTEYRKVGRSRKKTAFHTCRDPSEEQQQFYEKLMGIEERMTDEGVDFTVNPSYVWARLQYADCVRLVAPLEAVDEASISALAGLARRLITGQTTLTAEFPGYRYGRSEWTGERSARGARRALEKYGVP